VVHTVPGDLRNIHVTRPDELEVARRLFGAD
jgi:2-C-methyl-D-erythritol 4-phosphate cytidylyltransferase